MVRSMTGFGQAEVSVTGYQVTCEMKTVNHRFLDFNLRLSRRYSILEEKIREKVKDRLVRGRVDIFLNIERMEEAGRNIKVDNQLAMTYHNSLKDLAGMLQLSQDFNVIDIFRLPEVFNLEDRPEDLETLWGGIEKAMEQALNGLIGMREKEGRALAKDILERNEYILEQVGTVEARSPQVVRDYADKLKKRLEEIFPGTMVDENRIAQEIAIFADRASITEEIVRLKSHCEQMEKLMESDEPVGRKGDFLIQEMFREVNTISSKANDLQIGHTAVDLKSELEKMREQVQNIE